MHEPHGSNIVVSSPSGPIMSAPIVRSDVYYHAVYVLPCNVLFCFSAIESGSASVIFKSPEAMQNVKFTAAVRSYRERFCVVAFDETHCLSEWGDNFRPDYKKAVNLRSLVTKAPYLHCKSRQYG